MGSTPSDASPDATFDDLAAELALLFDRGVERPLDDAEFDRWALRVFHWQFAHSPAYRGYCEGRGATPRTVAPRPSQ